MLRNNTPKAEAIHRGFVRSLRKHLDDNINSKEAGSWIDYLYSKRMLSRCGPEWRERAKITGALSLSNGVQSELSAWLLDKRENNPAIAKAAFDLMGSFLPSWADYGLGFWERSIAVQRRCNWLLFDLTMVIREQAEIFAGEPESVGTSFLTLGKAMLPALLRGTEYLGTSHTIVLPDIASVEIVESLHPESVEDPGAVFLIAATGAAAWAYVREFRLATGQKVASWPDLALFARRWCERAVAYCGGSRPDAELTRLQRLASGEERLYGTSFIDGVVKLTSVTDLALEIFLIL